MGAAAVFTSGEYLEYARGRLEDALGRLDDCEVLEDAELAVMALKAAYDGPVGTITLDVPDIDDVIRPLTPECICTAGLLARGGYRGGCPVHSGIGGGF